MTVGLTLAATATASGALGGLGLSIVALVARIPPAPPRIAAAAVMAAAALDGFGAIGGRPRPLAVHRQVPREWGRIFSPVTAALLYGARLGIGPLTILTTWLWWAAALVVATLGVWPSVVVGAVFGLSRVATMVVVAPRPPATMATRMAMVRAADARVRNLVLAAVALCAAAATLV